VGRRHLSLVIAAGVVLVSAASAGTAVDWRKLASGPPEDAKVKTLTAFLASDSASTRTFSDELTYGDPAKLRHVDFSKDVVVAVFDAPTCKPPLPSVASVEQNGRVLAVRLRAPAPASTSCSPRWPGGYELVTLPRAGLRTPLPTRAVATYSS
jgi:hypothetical protein